jgi:N-formylglutamate deformylase
MKSVAILHVPHSSTIIPQEERANIILSEDDLADQILKMTDWYTDELFFQWDGRFEMVRYPVSRFVLDPERFENDESELMVKLGMGVIYTQTSEGKKLRDPVSPETRERMLNQYYRPHHRCLTRAVSSILSKHGKSLVLDCHSFPSAPQPYETDQRKERPDICLGTDPFHTPDWLTESIRSDFLNRGYSVEINRPFSGALVPINFYQKEKAISSIMIEVNRGLYLNEDTGNKRSSFTNVKEVIDGVVSSLINTFNEQNLE